MAYTINVTRLTSMSTTKLLRIVLPRTFSSSGFGSTMAYLPFRRRR